MTICELISNVSTIEDLLVWPTSCYYYFWLIVLIAIWGITSFSLYNSDKEKFIKSDLISSFGVASIVTIVLAVPMTIIKNSSDIPMLQSDLFLYIISGCIVFITIWFFKD